jgi:hypothetical protein
MTFNTHFTARYALDTCSVQRREWGSQICKWCSHWRDTQSLLRLYVFSKSHTIWRYTLSVFLFVLIGKGQHCLRYFSQNSHSVSSIMWQIYFTEFLTDRKINVEGTDRNSFSPLKEVRLLLRRFCWNLTDHTQRLFVDLSYYWFVCESKSLEYRAESFMHVPN